MEEYIDTVRKLVSSMEETAWLLSKFQDIKRNASQEQFKEIISKLDKKELEELQCKFDRFEKIIRYNL